MYWRSWIDKKKKDSFLFKKRYGTIIIKIVVLGLLLLWYGCANKKNSNSQESVQDSNPQEPIQDSNSPSPNQSQCENCGNADMVDGYHASNIPTPNTLLPLDGSGKLPADITGDANTLDGYDSSQFVKKEELASELRGTIHGYVFGGYSWELIYGQVYTSPIQGVTVELENTSFVTQTNDAGYFLLEEVPAGSYFLKLSKTGYCTERWQIMVLGNTFLWPYTLYPVPSKPSNVSVQNVGSGEVKIIGITTPGAVVIVYLSTTQNGKLQCPGASETDSTGYFEIRLYNLTSGQTYYYQLAALFGAPYSLIDNPDIVTNPPYCGEGYAIYRYCSSERVLGSFIAP
jgi:hypothetical protein